MSGLSSNITPGDQCAVGADGQLLDAKDIDWMHDPIQWWYSQRHRFPRLYLLARDILAIPGSAVAVERIFSGGRDTISLRRASLQPDTIRMLMIVKHNIRRRQT